MFTPSTISKNLVSTILARIDGHDIDTLIDTLNNIRELDGPRSCMWSRKGQGYKLAENDPVLYHGVSKFDRPTASAAGKARRQTQLHRYLATGCATWPSWTATGRHHTGDARRFAWCASTGTSRPLFRCQALPSNMQSPSAPGACEGKPVAIYSTFLQRAYDQLIHDVAPQNLPVVFAIDRAGTGWRRWTNHAGLRHRIHALHSQHDHPTPADENECRQADAVYGIPARRPDCRALSARHRTGMLPSNRHGGNSARQGRFAVTARKVARAGIRPHAAAGNANGGSPECHRWQNMRFVKPLDRNWFCRELAGNSHDLLVSIEEGPSGCRYRISEALASAGLTTPLAARPARQLRRARRPDRPAGRLWPETAAGIEQSVRHRPNILPA